MRDSADKAAPKIDEKYCDIDDRSGFNTGVSFLPNLGPRDSQTYEQE